MSSAAAICCQIEFLMLVVFHAGTVLAAPVSEMPCRFRISNDDHCLSRSFGGESSSSPVAYLVPRLGSFAVVIFLFGLSSFSSGTIRISFNDVLNKFAERHVRAGPGCWLFYRAASRGLVLSLS